MRTGRSSRRVCIAIQVAIAVLAMLPSARGGEFFSLKWAMDDERYARQYSAPYSSDPQTRRFQRVQEAIDARFQEGTYGTYVGGGGALNHWSAGQAEIGGFGMPTSWSTVRLGGIGTGADGQAFVGAIVDARIHAPTRFSPYVGLAGVAEFNHFAISHRYYHNYSYNNGGPPRRTLVIKGLAAIVPEVGVSYWLSPQTRLNVGVGWYVTNRGNPDFLMLNASLEFTTREQNIPAVSPAIPPQPYEDDRSDPYFSSYEPEQQDAALLNADLGTVKPDQIQLDLMHDQCQSVIENELFVPRLPIPGLLGSPLLTEAETPETAQGSKLGMFGNAQATDASPAATSSDQVSTEPWLRDRTVAPNQ